MTSATRNNEVGYDSYQYHSIEYDNNGNITHIERPIPGHIRHSNFNNYYATNQVNRIYNSLDDSNQQTLFRTYTYDPRGNVSSFVQNAQAGQTEKSESFTYDIVSNLVTRICVSQNNERSIISYTYDSNGERISKNHELNGVNRWEYYINSLSSQPLVTVNENGDVTYYIYGANGLIAQKSLDHTSYFVKDHAGTIRVVLNENNAIISTYDYDAWGNQVNNTVSEESRYLYTGREYDTDTALYNFRARLYDSVVMRFSQTDPAEQSASPYSYCGNNPIMMIDPDGQEFIASQTIQPLLRKIVSPAMREYINFDQNCKLDWQGLKNGYETYKNQNPGFSDLVTETAIRFGQSDMLIKTYAAQKFRASGGDIRDQNSLYNPSFGATQYTEDFVKAGNIKYLKNATKPQAEMIINLADRSNSDKNNCLTLAHEMGHVDAYLTWAIPAERREKSKHAWDSPKYPQTDTNTFLKGIQDKLERQAKTNYLYK